MNTKVNEKELPLKQHGGNLRNKFGWVVFAAVVSSSWTPLFAEGSAITIAPAASTTTLPAK